MNIYEDKREFLLSSDELDVQVHGVFVDGFCEIYGYVGKTLRVTACTHHIVNQEMIADARRKAVEIFATLSHPPAPKK